MWKIQTTILRRGTPYAVRRWMAAQMQITQTVTRQTTLLDVARAFNDIWSRTRNPAALLEALEVSGIEMPTLTQSVAEKMKDANAIKQARVCTFGVTLLS
jgi:hypothetical protein